MYKYDLVLLRNTFTKMVGDCLAAIYITVCACNCVRLSYSTPHTGSFHSPVDCFWQPSGGQGVCESAKGGNAMLVKCACVM